MRRAVLFDFFNTLLSGGDKRRHAVAREMGADVGADPDAFATLFAQTWHERMIGALGDLAAQVRHIATRLGVDPSETAVATAVRRRYELAEETIVPDDGSVAVLGAVRAAGWRVAIVSNCTVESGSVIHRTRVAALADAVVLSCDVGMAKPDPAIYRLACARAGITEPRGSVFVGDGADDELRGASDLSMRVIQTTQYASHPVPWSGETIATLADLPKLIGRAA